MDVAKTSAETALKRERNVEDLQKRSTYRRAHGLEDENSQGLGGWTARSDEESVGSGGGPVGVEPGQEVEAKVVVEGRDATEGPLKIWAGQRRPVKKWFGIW